MCALTINSRLDFAESLSSLVDAFQWHARSANIYYGRPGRPSDEKSGLMKATRTSADKTSTTMASRGHRPELRQADFGH